MSLTRKKIVIAAGGTGGHLFPAQAFAKEIIEKGVDVLFVGSGLGKNPYFQQAHFPFQEVASSTPFRKQLSSKFRSVFSLLKGTVQSCVLLKKTKPDLVIGFGSFHSFPVMLAAVVLRVPLVVFESNAIPGRVNRLFSRWALCATVQFSSAASHLFGRVEEVAMPFRRLHGDPINREQAFAYYGLPSNRLTLLVFGGSQGAVAINRLFCQAVALLKGTAQPFQVVHFAGNEKEAREVEKEYVSLGIAAHVKPFEKNMEYAWKVADVAICRAGAATISELIAFAVPALLIPYPYATDQHQKKNALFLEKKIGAVLCREEADLTKEGLATAIQDMLDADRRAFMQGNINAFKQKERKQSLSTFILNLLHKRTEKLPEP